MNTSSDTIKTVSTVSSNTSGDQATPPNETMAVSARGLKALANREGQKLRAYQDERMIWTIGIGHTAAAGPPIPVSGMYLTEASMMALFAADLKPYQDAVNGSLKTCPTQNQFDACVSLCYNIGVNGFRGSSVVHHFNSGDVAGAANAFLMWETPADLASRRIAERKQFLGGQY